MISGNALLSGVIGYPVAHSLSPRLHQYWLARYKVDGAYIPLAVSPDDLAGVIRVLPRMGFRGVNITLPHKEAVLDLVDEMDETAKKIGAINTLIFRDGRVIGRNTDAYGFITNLTSQVELDFSQTKAVVLGAGGAARGICVALQEAGVSEIVLINRTRDRAEAMAASLDKTIRVADWSARHDVLSTAGLLVNTTSAGMKGKDPLDVQLDTLPVESVVTDIVYTPLMTPLLEAAKARGNRVVDGLGMLIHQAVPGFEAWFGHRPDVAGAEKDHLLEVLQW